MGDFGKVFFFLSFFFSGMFFFICLEQELLLIISEKSFKTYFYLIWHHESLKNSVYFKVILIGFSYRTTILPFAVPGDTIIPRRLKEKTSGCPESKNKPVLEPFGHSGHPPRETEYDK